MPFIYEINEELMILSYNIVANIFAIMIVSLFLVTVDVGIISVLDALITFQKPKLRVALN